MAERRWLAGEQEGAHIALRVGRLGPAASSYSIEPRAGCDGLLAICQILAVKQHRGAETPMGGREPTSPPGDWYSEPTFPDWTGGEGSPAQWPSGPP